MSWEWVALLSVLAVCSTIFAVLKLSLSPQNATSQLEFESRLSQIEKDHVVISQLALDTKKLLSEANLVKGLRPQR